MHMTNTSVWLSWLLLGYSCANVVFHVRVHTLLHGSALSQLKNQVFEGVLVSGNRGANYWVHSDALVFCHWFFFTFSLFVECIFEPVWFEIFAMSSTWARLLMVWCQAGRSTVVLLLSHCYKNWRNGAVAHVGLSQNPHTIVCFHYGRK